MMTWDSNGKFTALLMQMGCNPNENYNKDNSALHLASSHTQKVCISLLICYGADVTALNKEGKTAVDVAGGEETLYLLLCHGCESKNGSGLKDSYQDIIRMWKNSVFE